MRQVLFPIPVPHFLQSLLGLGPTLPIFSYGLMLVIGFLAAIYLARWLARRHGADPEFFSNAAIIALVTGIIGARASHVLENFSDFTRSDLSAWENFRDMINIRSGGLTYYGGFLLAFPCLVVYGWKKQFPIRLGMDIVAPCLMVAYGFGRIGCFLNGCCYGANCSGPLGISFPYASLAYVDQVDRGTLHPPPQFLAQTSVAAPRVIPPAQLPPNLRAQAFNQQSLPVLPTQLYSAFTAFLIAALLLAYSTLPHAPGHVFALMCVIEGVTRYILELVRAEPTVWGRASIGMITGVVVTVMGLLLWREFTQAQPSAHRTSAL